MNTKKHDVPEELLSGLLANYRKPEDLIDDNGLLTQLTTAATRIEWTSPESRMRMVTATASSSRRMSMICPART